MAAPRVLITGVSGFLGSNLAVFYQRRGWEVWGSYHGTEQSLPGVALRKLDVCLPGQVEAVVAEAAPELLIHAAAMARPDDCAADPAATRHINVQGAKLVAAAAAKAGSKLVFTSTDQVLDGTKALSSEDDPARPLGLYGRSKLDAEAEVLKAEAARPLVLRLALTYGWGRGRAKGRNFSEQWLRAFLTGGRIQAYTDQFRSVLYAEDAAMGLAKAVEAGLEGVLNLAGPERVSRHAFASALAREFGFPEALVHAASADDVAPPDPRPKDASLSITRLTQSTGYEPRDPAAGLKAMHAELERL